MSEKAGTLQLFSTAGRLATSGRRVTLHLPDTHTWGTLLTEAITTLRTLAAAPG